MNLRNIISVTLFYSVSLFAIDPSSHLSFKNIECDKTNSCNLLSFDLKTYNTKEIEIGRSKRKTYWAQTLMEGSLSLKSKEAVDEFAVVQYIKGCVFTKTQLNDEKPNFFHKQRHRIFFGKKTSGFSHPKFVIDSFDTDPIYASREFDRHGNYKVLLKPTGSVLFSDRKDWMALSEKPVIEAKPTIYFSDMPTGSYYSKMKIVAGEDIGKILKTEERASMIFKTCVFKTKDVPRDLKPENINTNKAIKCFDWSNSQKFNFNLSKFEFRKEVDVNCPQM